MVVEIRDNDSLQKLEEVEFSRALFELYEGGVVSLFLSGLLIDGTDEYFTVYAPRGILYCNTLSNNVNFLSEPLSFLGI